ncbi:hypothetical protein THIARS_70683 [Thiomonas delicata]|uniref:Uncharacterized protein n=1 Tax=Thiomonas delicata TaxID=364030 RepID=A0A238D6X3_THIDL|nr:hypothetical protein THIARS_70683 [Thiomonas delicata]
MGVGRGPEVPIAPRVPARGASSHLRSAPHPTGALQLMESGAVFFGVRSEVASMAGLPASSRFALSRGESVEI